MIIKTIFLSLLLFSLSQSINLVYLGKIPVNALTLVKTVLSLNNLQKELDKNFGQLTQNKNLMYVRTLLTQSYLKQINQQLKPLNNIVIGENSAVSGNANFIITDNTDITGSGNWVFSQGFNGQVNHDLILDNWQVQLDKTPKILTTPKEAIRKW